MAIKDKQLTRRALLTTLAKLGIGVSLLPLSTVAQQHNQSLNPNTIAYQLKAAKFLKKTIPSTGQTIHPIGMGTWITFNVGKDTVLRNERTKVLDTFFQLGGEVVDSSPMYGSAEEVLGYGLTKLKANSGNYPSSLFAATKTWTSSKSEGKQQFKDSQQLWQQARFALLQIHNLVAWQQHLPMLRELKQQGLLKYIGVTTSHGRRHRELAKIMATEPIDFVQLTYNILDREVEQELLPLAQDKGIAIIANRPFQGGRLMQRFEREPLPAWATELGCDNWPQYFLRFVISHPALTCTIPATSKVEHMQENMSGANIMPLPNAQQRQQMIAYLNTL
ncbi:aldo/keto reductase [Thalassotalea euphylliae]|uniref:Aldo/keto reductase n=1 Tax=Thalassotalea euphylliae TaxID=1655234 RepID=A0A3E0UC85_9GAMM|nr:aldo/keto reductase [Thalassotalea euphylliae]REL34203.1 aldo/keto reductase [Thalassotalea euphylliae]